MDYANARYVVLMLFAPRTDRALSALDDFLLWLANSVPVGTLVQKGIAYFDRLKLRQLRRRRFEPGKAFQKWDSAISEANEVGIYVYDDAFSKTFPPCVFANIHLSHNGGIHGIKIEQGATQSSEVCFALIAVRTDIADEISAELSAKLHEFFDDVGASTGKLWKSMSYVYDGKSSFEWAYRNVPQSLKGERVQDWDMIADRDLVK